MSLTLTRIPFGAESTGKFRRRQYNVTGDNAPPVGGYSVTGLQVGCRNGSIVGVSKVGGNALASSYGVTWDSANSKLVFTTGSGAVSPATDLSGVTVRLEFITST